MLIYIPVDDEFSDRGGDQIPVNTRADTAGFQTVKQVLDVLKEGRMDVGGFSTQ